MKLFYSPGACSLAPHIAARETGLTLTLQKVDLATHRLADGSAYHAINPRGYVPAMQFDDGTVHTEVASLLQFIADRAPKAGLLAPAGSPERLQTIEWVSFVASELHRTFSPWLWHKETPDATKKACRDKLAVRFAELDSRLDGRQWLAGETFTIADIYCFTIVNWSNFLGIPLASTSHLQAYLARVAERPAVREALVAEGLVKS